MGKRYPASGAEDLFESLAGRLSSSPDISKGVMFGFPCIKVKGKVFAVSFQGDMVFKLVEYTRPQALALSDASLWNPFGRVKSKWVQIPLAHAAAWEEFANSACAFVTSLI